MKTQMTSLLLSLALAVPVWAQAQTPPASAPVSAASADSVDGEVRKIDKEASRLTLKHGEIKNLDMPGMTMVFHVKDKTWLDALKVGDKVRFKAAHEAGKYVVTDISVAP